MQDVKNNFRISRIYGAIYEIFHPDFGYRNATLKGKLRLEKKRERHPFVVGDWISVELTEPEAVIVNKQPRTNQLIRQNSFKDAHVLCANVDYLIVLASLHQPQTKDGFIDRCLSACHFSGIAPLIILNKRDLVNDDWIAGKKQKYESLGYRVFAINSLDKESIEDLWQIIQGNTGFFVGNSGVGKSTLLNALVQGHGVEQQKTNLISESTSKGKHTTTNSRAIFLPQQTVLIDSPGIKEWGLLHMQKYQVLQSFPEFQSLQEQCQLTNCCRGQNNCHLLDHSSTIPLASDRQKSLDAILFTIENPGKQKPGQYTRKGIKDQKR